MVISWSPISWTELSETSWPSRTRRFMHTLTWHPIQARRAFISSTSSQMSAIQTSCRSKSIIFLLNISKWPSIHPSSPYQEFLTSSVQFQANPSFFRSLTSEWPKKNHDRIHPIIISIMVYQCLLSNIIRIYGNFTKILMKSLYPWRWNNSHIPLVLDLGDSNLFVALIDIPI